MLVSEETNREIGVKGRAIYDVKLKAILEPERNGEWVVIHVDTGDYAVARRHSEASKVMRERHEVDGRLLSMRIGPPTDADTRLAGRLFAHTITEASIRRSEVTPIIAHIVGGAIVLDTPLAETDGTEVEIFVLSRD